MGFTVVGMLEVAGSNPVAPTVFREKPFGEYVEGLFHCDGASYRSTSVFKWHCTMVEITRKSDGTPLFVWRNVVQIPSPVLRRQLCELPTRLNEQWAMDFMHDSLADGTTFRVMTLIDLYSRECLAARPCQVQPHVRRGDAADAAWPMPNE
jgi:transposase InsO family protein